MKQIQRVFLMTCCLLAIGFVSRAFAVSLVCDAQTGVTQYQIDWNRSGNWTAFPMIPAQADGSLSLDLTATAPGTFTAQVRGGAQYELDGVPQGGLVWSNPTPFVLKKPAMPTAPAGIGLGP